MTRLLFMLIIFLLFVFSLLLFAIIRGKSLGSMQVDHFNSFEVKTSDKVKKFYNSLNGGEPYTETWSDTIEIFDNDVQNKIEEQREVAEHYKDTFCKLCKTQCTVRQTMTNKNGNKGRWFITCPAGNSSEGHTFSFVVASPRKQNPYTSRISYLIPKPGINGAIRDKLKGKRFVSTGVFPQLGGGEGLTVGKEKLKEMIVSFGGVVTGSISGKTDYLIRGEDPGQVKLDQAQSRGVTALDLDDIRKILLGHSAFPPTQTDPMSHSMKSFFGNNHEIQQHS